MAWSQGRTFEDKAEKFNPLAWPKVSLARNVLFLLLGKLSPTAQTGQQSSSSYVIVWFNIIPWTYKLKLIETSCEIACELTSGFVWSIK